MSIIMVTMYFSAYRFHTYTQRVIIPAIKGERKRVFRYQESLYTLQHTTKQQNKKKLGTLPSWYMKSTTYL